jgi:hypothetical protein
MRRPITSTDTTAASQEAKWAGLIPMSRTTRARRTLDVLTCQVGKKRLIEYFLRLGYYLLKGPAIRSTGVSPLARKTATQEPEGTNLCYC